ncbi:MAG: hypothetical protein H0U95_15570 [Bacteroidetes bacterium]|nr:hypothetical protein [Bacteroidota bacterium]
MRLDIRSEYSRLLSSKDLQVMIESYKIITDTGFSIFYEHGKEGTKTSWDYDGNLLYQMTMLKCLSVLKLAEPINYTNDVDGTSLKNTYDPFSVYNLVRAQYEAFCNFNNIYIQSKSTQEIELKYYLWVLSGLNYRQRFKVEAKENVEKKAHEKKEIDDIIATLELNTCYIQLEDQSKKNIQDGIKKRDWQYKIEGNKASKIAWHEMMTNAGTNDMLEGQYSFLSLNTHPSNVSVFQFGAMYNENEQESFTRMAMQLSKILVALSIRDYCVYFPTCMKTFNKLPSMHQMLINTYNRMFRDESYVLNNHGEDF